MISLQSLQWAILYLMRLLHSRSSHVNLKQQHQQSYQTSNSVIVTTEPLPIQHRQLPPPPRVKPANPVIAVEVHQPPSYLQQPQQLLHQVNSPHQLQWSQLHPSMLHRSADDQSMPSNININICSIELIWDGKITKIWYDNEMRGIRITVWNGGDL